MYNWYCTFCVGSDTAVFELHPALSVGLMLTADERLHSIFLQPPPFVLSEFLFSDFLSGLLDLTTNVSMFLVWSSVTLAQLVFTSLPVFSTGRDIASITHLEVKCLFFFQGSETNDPTYFLSVLNTGHQLRTQEVKCLFFFKVVRQMSLPISCLCWTLLFNNLHKTVDRGYFTTDT